MDSGAEDDERFASFLRLHVFVEADAAAVEVEAGVSLAAVDDVPALARTAVEEETGSASLAVEEGLVAATVDEWAAAGVELEAEGAFELDPELPEPPLVWPEREPVTASVKRVAPLGQKVMRRPTLSLWQAR